MYLFSLSYSLYLFSNSSPYKFAKSGQVFGQNRLHLLFFLTLFINRSGTHKAKNISLALSSSEPTGFLRLQNSNISACHGSIYIAYDPFLLPSPPAIYLETLLIILTNGIIPADVQPVLVILLPI